MLLKHIYIACTLLALSAFAMSCSHSTASQASARKEIVRKYSPDELREDFDVMRNILEKFHPSLYWYTSKDSMDMLFNAYRAAIRDSMTQQQFGFSVLAPITTAIRCGHTSFNFSKKYNEGMRGLRLPSFPLFLKVYEDSMIVIGNLNRRDSAIRRGTTIMGIDGQSVDQISSTMFRYMPTDGFANNINYIRLSNNFPYYHRNIYGLKKTYQVSYLDSVGQVKSAALPLYEPAADTLNRPRRDSTKRAPRPPKPSRSQRMKDIRSLQYIAPGDSIPSASKIPGGTMVMTLNSFDGDAHLPGFFRRSFRLMREQKATNLVIDIRSNGGGKVNHYARLASYLKVKKFRVADSAYSIRKGFGSYGKYFPMRTLNAMALGMFTTKRDDGKYHFRYWENHVVKPRKKDFFTGKVYLVISGPTFSASTLFAHTMKGQQNVTLVGEETGGGAYGNNGLMIPNITLPNTAMRVRMPMFRLVQYQHGPKDGKGVTPDVNVGPSGIAAVNNIDLKMKAVLQLIQSSNGERIPVAQER